MPGEEVVEDENQEEQGSDFEMDGEDKQEVSEYIKKEFVARPYVSPYETEKDVQMLNPKNTR